MPSVRRVKDIKWSEEYDDYYSSSDSDIVDIKPATHGKSKRTTGVFKERKANVSLPKDSSSVVNRNPLNVVVCGLVDAGKSTLLGHFLTLINSIEGGLEKIKDYSWILDQGEDERERGITIDPTKCQFNLKLPLNTTGPSYDSIKVNIIDTPGHHDLIYNLILGATFANSVVMIVDCNDVLKSNNFNVYFNEHYFLLYVLGIRYFIICINKLDRYNYASDIYDNVVKCVNSLLENRYKYAKNIFIPTSGLNGINLIEHSNYTSWYDGPSLLEALQDISLEIASNPVVLYEDRVLCHVYDIWEVGKNIYSTTFVEGCRLKLPLDMVILPNGVAVKCHEPSNATCSSGIRDTISQLICGVSNEAAADLTYYINDFVDVINIRGSDISNLIPCTLMVDSNTYSRIKMNISSIRRIRLLTCFIRISFFTEQHLTIGQSVEVNVGYTGVTAVIKSIKVNRKMKYSLGPDESAIIGLETSTFVFAEPICHEECNDELSSSNRPTGILSKILIRSNGNIIAGGIICSDKQE